MVQHHKELIALGALLQAGLIVLLAATGLDRGSVRLEIFFWLPFAIYLLAVWRTSRTKKAIAPWQTAAIILLFAVVFHATLLLSPSPLSNDIYRYYWDGKVLDHGINPYTYSPDAAQVAYLRDANWQEVMNKDVNTMYPPLSQFVFAAAYSVFPGTWTLKVFSTAFNLAAIVVLILILRELGLDESYSILYAWSPLATIEFANSGHIDSLAVLFVLLSFFTLVKNARSLSAAALALGVLSKIYPLLFAVLFLPYWKKRGSLIFAAIIAVAYLPFLGANTALWQGSSYFVGRGLFNGSIFPLLLNGLQEIMWRPQALQVAKLLVLFVFVCLLGWLFACLHSQKENALLLWEYSFWLTGSFLLLTPTMEPWYLIWVLPFLCFFQSTGWILLTGTAIFARSIYIGYEATGVWQEIEWIKFAEYGIPFLLILWDPIRKINRWMSNGAREKRAGDIRQGSYPRSSQDAVSARARIRGGN